MAVSSIDLLVLHHLFVPAGDLQQRPYSSSLPYRAGDDTLILGITPDPRSPRPEGRDEFERLERAAATGHLMFGLAAAPLGGRFRRLGSLHIEDRPHTPSTPCASTRLTAAAGCAVGRDAQPPP